ncbi:MAG TPA: ABC transporter ATP-binding protein [Anaerolineales bacterium]|nr:ABC transporter ATP-binding protein [Anaerolineales bacterium]
MLRIDGLVSGYGKVVALHGVSLEVETGEIVAIIGSNGAGKTTLLNTLTGLMRASAGKVSFGDQDITNTPAHRIVRLGIGHVPERRQMFDSLSVRDNLLLGAYHRFRREKRSAIEGDLMRVCDMFPILRERLKAPAETLSGGMQQMLAIARGLMARPTLLLLDEPSLGLAPLLVQEIFHIIGELRRQGTTVLLVEQNARAALRVADRGYVLETGNVSLSGTAAELAANGAVQRAYLGGRYSSNHRGRGALAPNGRRR